MSLDSPYLSSVVRAGTTHAPRTESGLSIRAMVPTASIISRWLSIAPTLSRCVQVSRRGLADEEGDDISDCSAATAESVIVSNSGWPRDRARTNQTMRPPNRLPGRSAARRKISSAR